MVRVIPFEECVARPRDTKKHLLTEHLISVARGCGDPRGSPEERLGFLKGLLHDVGKAIFSWQSNIGKADGALPLHSWLGSYMYGILADQLWKGQFCSKPELLTMIMTDMLDINDHHSRLEDVDDLAPPWYRHARRNPNIWFELDLDGFWLFIREFYPSIEILSAEGIFAAHMGLRKRWIRWATRLHREVSKWEDAVNSVVRSSTANLILADRLHAAGAEEVKLSRREIEQALLRLENYLKSRFEQDRGSPKGKMAYLRQAVQEEVLAEFEQHLEGSFFSLELPTGMGKTICGTKLALQLALTDNSDRILYVAPYLSILSQAAASIRETTQLPVLEHHHLSALQTYDYQSKGDISIYVESWQAPVIATTFNQLFRAVLPARAQQSMGLAALKNSVVIIDEPQIFQPEIWHLLLYVLKPLSEKLGCKVLFMSATMPSLDVLDAPVVRLGTTRTIPSRFQITARRKPWDEADVAKAAVHSVQESQSTAVILNTIKDCVNVYKLCRKSLGHSNNLINLHGAMTPMHKKQHIHAVYTKLAAGVPCLVVSTQVIEAGVDLSFQQIYRARPILPSVIQSAGRANRHGEGKLAEIEVFDFYREGIRDTRNYVYLNTIARNITDELLPRGDQVQEDDVERLAREYYKTFLGRFPAEGGKDRIHKAARGKWSALSQIEVFEETWGHITIFVPHIRFDLDPDIIKVMHTFGCKEPIDVYERYCERGWLATLDFATKKLFIALLMQFTVSASYKLAHKVAAYDDTRSIWLLVDEEAYNEDVGLGASFGHEDDGFML